MKYEADKVKELQIAYIGGGSMGWAWGLMSDLALEEQLSGTVKLYDIDYEAAKRNEKIATKLQSRDEVLSDWKYEAVETIQEALEGADFVMISILPGTFEEMRSDVHAPEKFGIYQSVGDTVGPGGVFRALRTIPMIAEIAKAIKDYAPEAWVINFTNPMSLCTRTLYEVFPGIKAFGNCHEVFGTQKLLVNALEDIKGIEGVGREEIRVNVLGINHFTWINQASYKGMDLFPVYDEFVQKHYEEGFSTDKTGNWLNDYFTCGHRVKFDLYQRFGCIAAAGDRHLAEFCPNTWYLKDKDQVKNWRFGLTPVQWRIEDRQKRLEKSYDLAEERIEFTLNPTGEEGIRQMKAILGLEDLVTNVNLPNLGQIPNLPIGAVVETNALFCKNSVQPVMAGAIPNQLISLISRHVHNQELVLQAALQRDYKKAFQAFVQDPLMQIPVEEARKCFDEMYENTKMYL